MSEKSTKNQFSSKLGLILSVLGIAVGTGNIWRFPRIVAQNGGDDGGGAFIVAWVLFLFLWSIPLIIAEYGLGKIGRASVLHTFAKTGGKKNAWMGGFVVIVTCGILFYYSVVVGWCLYYLGNGIFSGVPLDLEGSKAIWTGFQSGPFPIILHALAMAGGCFIVIKGIKAIEKANTILVPALLVIVLLCFVRAITLENASAGLTYLFTADWSTLSHPSIWLEALTQNAWDTGAGWGLILTYAVYMRKSDSIFTSAFQTGIGNNLVSLLAATIIFSTVFGTLSQSMSNAEIMNVMRDSGPASTGLTFIWMPLLFAKIPFGKVIAVLFFLALSFAAFSSLLSMIEMAAKVLVDRGMERKKASITVSVAAFVFGLPSALSSTFFANQDFVWGIGLIISGAFMAYNIRTFRARKLVKLVSLNDKVNSFHEVWIFLIKFMVPLQAVILIGWWLYRSAFEFAADDWYNPFSAFSPASCIFQWLLAGLFLFIFKNKLLGNFELDKK